MDEPLVSKRPGGHIVVARELSVIDVGDGLKVEVHRRINGDEREHGRNVSHDPPLDAPLCTIGGTEQCAETLEEQDDHDP